MMIPTSWKVSGLYATICLALLTADDSLVEQVDSVAAGMSAGRLAQIAPRLKQFVDDGKTAGIVTLIARHGHVASLEALGYQDLETKTPMKTDTIFRIMSVTKPITCAGVMVLVDEGRLAARSGREVHSGIRRDSGQPLRHPERL